MEQSKWNYLLEKEDEDGEDNEDDSEDDEDDSDVDREENSLRETPRKRRLLARDS